MEQEPQYLVSVIVPVYNKKEYVAKCLDSILAQTYKKWELLLVDDGSVDGSGEICDRYAGQDGRVRTIHQKNAGPTAACVTGMKEAAGSYFMFVDGDDYLEPGMVAGMAAYLTGAPGEVVCCNYVMEKQRETLRVRNDVKPGVYEKDQLEQIKAGLIGREKRTLSLSRCMKLCERSLFEGNEIYYDYSLRFGDDANLMYPALLGSSRIVVMEDAFYYHYRYVQGSLVHSYDKGLFEKVQRLMTALSREAKEKKAPDGKAAVTREYCYMLLYVIKNELRSPDRDYRKRIRDIFGENETKALLNSTPIPVTERSNRLLYLGMCHPNSALLCLLRLLLRLYDKGKD